VFQELTSNMKGAGERIRTAVAAWPAVEAFPHRFGGTEYRYGRRELGHVHGDRLADLPVPRKVHDAVITAGRAQPHHVLPETGWVSCWMAGAKDAARVIELFRMQYDRYVAARPDQASAPRPPSKDIR
jgi:Family of unknown function (DUF5519)